MRISYLIKRLKFRLSIDGLQKTFKEMFFYNREIAVVEKNIDSYGTSKYDKNITYTVVNRKNSKQIEEKFNLPLFDHYAKKNCITLIATQNNECLGFIRWTRDKNFRDLKKFRIDLKDDQAYMFDFFLFPKYRGTPLGKDISTVAIDRLRSLGISKFFGYFFSDNLPALWWHRAILDAVEFKKIKTHRFLTMELVDGKLFL